MGVLSAAGFLWSFNLPMGPALDASEAGQSFTCARVRVLDGDTFKCDGQSIRMVGIDAPELPGHCRPGRECTPGDPYASSANLEALIAGGEVACRTVDTDAYGRTVARCTAGDVDLSCEQMQGGFAVSRYGAISC